MKNFAMVKARSLPEATESLGADWNTAAVLAGGTDLLGEMKTYIFTPSKVVNIKAVKDLAGITTGGNALTIGAVTTLSDVAGNSAVRRNLPALSSAAAAVGSPQIRNMGTIGGNICQRPRCWYYRDTQVICIRKGGNRCNAVVGRNKYHAIIAGGPCHIVSPSDTAVALMAYDAALTIAGGSGEKEVAVSDFFVLPRTNARRENILNPGDILTNITVPLPDQGTKSTFIKVQERDAWDFAVASTAVSLTVKGGTCTKARIVLGAAAPVPWRAEDAEKTLEGKLITRARAEAAAEAAVAGSRPMRENSYKTELFKNIVKRAILDLA